MNMGHMNIAEIHNLIKTENINLKFHTQIHELIMNTCMHNHFTPLKETKCK